MQSSLATNRLTFLRCQPTLKFNRKILKIRIRDLKLTNRVHQQACKRAQLAFHNNNGKTVVWWHPLSWPEMQPSIIQILPNIMLWLTIIIKYVPLRQRVLQLWALLGINSYSEILLKLRGMSIINHKLIIRRSNHSSELTIKFSSHCLIMKLSSRSRKETLDSLMILKLNPSSLSKQMHLRKDSEEDKAWTSKKLLRATEGINLRYHQLSSSLICPISQRIYLP